MFVALLLTTMLAAPEAGAQAAQLPTMAQAQELAQQGNFDAALDAYRRRAAVDPKDFTARLGIARIHEQRNRPDLAEPVYRSVMLESPENVDAMAGVGRTLVSLRRGDEALLVLDRAARAAPTNADVMRALGIAHLQVANIKLGLSYLDMAVTLAPTQENREALEAARRAHGHQVTASAFFEQFTGLSDTGSGNLVLDYRVADRLRVAARGQYQRKFGVSDQRGGAALEWRWHPQTMLRIQGLAGPDNEILPRADALIQIAHTQAQAGWDLSYRFVNFEGANASVVSPGVRWYGERASIGLRYALAITNFDALPDAEDGHTGSLDGDYRIQRRVWLNLGYTYGVDDFDTLSPDRLGRFRAHTVRGGMRFHFNTLTSFQAVYEHQWRAGDAEMNRVSGFLTQAF